MRETIAFNNASNEWVSRYSYTSSCFGWIKDHMVSAPVSTSSADATTNNSFYGCDPASSGVSFSFNANPSVNKIYKSFSIESPDILTWGSDDNGAAIFNTFIVNNGTGNGYTKRVVLNKLKSLGGILYGGVKGTEEYRSNSRVQPIGTIDRVILEADFENYFGFDPGVAGAGAYVKISGPRSHFSGGDARLVVESSASLGADPDTEASTATELVAPSGGLLLAEDMVTLIYPDPAAEEGALEQPEQSIGHMGLPTSA